MSWQLNEMIIIASAEFEAHYPIAQRQLQGGLIHQHRQELGSLFVSVVLLALIILMLNAISICNMLC